MPGFGVGSPLSYLYILPYCAPNCKGFSEIFSSFFRFFFFSCAHSRSEPPNTKAAKQTLALTDPAPFVRLTKQNDSSLDFTVRVWTKKEDYWTVHFDLLEAIQKRLEAEKIEIPFPQLDVHVKNDANA